MVLIFFKKFNMFKSLRNEKTHLFSVFSFVQGNIVAIRIDYSQEIIE